MSRIGKKPIDLPGKTKASLVGATVAVEGPKGKLTVQVSPKMKISIEGQVLVVERPDDSREARALHGLTRALLANAVHGVSEGFVRELEINGVGYRAEAKGKQINLTLGYSHPVVYDLPEGVTAKTPAPTKIILESPDKQALGMAASQVRMLRPPEPYKGKGIKYADEHIRRKVGKTGA